MIDTEDLIPAYEAWRAVRNAAGESLPRWSEAPEYRLKWAEDFAEWVFENPHRPAHEWRQEQRMGLPPEAMAFHSRAAMDAFRAVVLALGGLSA